jgi:hypothetical protein
MSRTEQIVHACIAAAWVSLAVVLGLKIALLGSEQASLERARGQDRKLQFDLGFQQEKLRAQLAFEASPPALEDAVRRLQLPLQAPTRTASR